MGLRPQTRSEKCLQGSDPLLPASQQGAAQSPGPALGEPLRWPDQRQGWDSSQPGHVNPVSIYERNDVSVWKVRSKCGRIDTQPKLVRETMNTTISTWMKFFFIWSWHSLLLTPSSTKRQKMTFCFAVETLESTLSEAKELILHYLFFFFLGQIFSKYFACHPALFKYGYWGSWLAQGLSVSMRILTAANYWPFSR